MTTDFRSRSILEEIKPKFFFGLQMNPCDSETLGDLPGVIQLVNGRDETRTRSSDSRSCRNKHGDDDSSPYYLTGIV